MKSLALAAVLSLGAMPALADDQKLARVQEQAAKVEEIQSQLVGNVSTTKDLIAQLQADDIDDASAAVTQVFEKIEADTRAALDTIALDSEFQDALDAMRSEIEVLIQLNENAPATARRDARLDRLNTLQARYNDQFDRVSELEDRLTGRLIDIKLERREVELDLQVDDVAAIVDALGMVVSNLEELDTQLAEVSQAVYEAPEVAQN